ncbi:MAG: type II toxin-antitoxin system VapC family toxin [Planctomycetes bacterium]|nr:type II toxin-antitoxin system VapC family toxin [Planctomycetota bacterium]
MIAVLDACAAVECALGESSASKSMILLKEAEWVIAPDLFIAEVANTFWKYHSFSEMSKIEAEERMTKAMDLVDDLFDSSVMAREAFSLAVDMKHPVYDALYLVLARRHDAVLLTSDKKLKVIASKLSISLA